MKIAAIALASALASFSCAQPSLAQSGNQDRDQTGQMQYGPGPHNQFRGGMGRDQETYGQGQNWRQHDDWRQSDNDNWRPDGARMEGRMGHMGMGGMGSHMHSRFAEEQGASFSFGNGRARMSVHCPASEPVETCVRAASQLLDKITSLRSGSAGTTNGAGTGNSGASDNSRTTPQLNRDGGRSSGQQNDDEQ